MNKRWMRLWGRLKLCLICSPGWTRTTNPSVNSRMLCQLSYRGLLGVRMRAGADRGMTLAYRLPTPNQTDRPPQGTCPRVWGRMDG